MKIDDTINALFNEIVDEFYNAKGVTIDKELVHFIIDFQFRFVRNCIRGGQDVTLPLFGGWKKYNLDDPYTQAKVVLWLRDNGGYKRFFTDNPFKPKNDINPKDMADEVIYDGTLYPGLTPIPKFPGSRRHPNNRLSRLPPPAIFNHGNTFKRLHSYKHYKKDASSLADSNNDDESDGGESC